MSVSPSAAAGTATNSYVQVEGIDHFHLPVGNTTASVAYFKQLGFNVVARSGPEDHNVVSYVMRQEKICVVLSTGLHPDHPFSRRSEYRGNSPDSIALQVPDVKEAHAVALERGAKSIQSPEVHQDHYGKFRTAIIEAYGDVKYKLLSRNDYRGPFAPGYVAVENANNSVGLVNVDHVVANVIPGEMNAWKTFHAQVFGMETMAAFDDGEEPTFDCIVLGNHHVIFGANEPHGPEGVIANDLRNHGGDGVHHIALLTNNIVQSVGTMMDRGIQFNRTPLSYYDDLGKHQRPYSIRKRGSSKA